MNTTRHTTKTSPESLRPRSTHKASTSPIGSRNKSSQKKSQTKSAIATNIAHANMQQFSRLTPDEKELLEIVKRSTQKSPEKPPRENPKSSVHSEKSKVSTNKGKTQSVAKSSKSSVNKGSTKKIVKKVPIEEKENEEDDEVIEVPRERKAQDLMMPDPISGFFRDAQGRLTPKPDPLEIGTGKRAKSTSENIDPNSSRNSSVNKNNERSRRMSSNASPISRGKEKRTPVEELSSRLDVIFEDSQYDVQIEVQRVGESNRQYVTSFSQEITEMEIMNRNNENKNNDVMEIEEKPVIVVPTIEVLPPRRTALKSVRRIESLIEPPRRRLLTRNSEILDHEPEVINIEDNQPKEVIEVIEEEPQQNLDDSTIRVPVKNGASHEEEEGDDVIEIIETSKPKSESIKSEEDKLSENFEKQRSKLQRWREQHENLMNNTENKVIIVVSSPLVDNPETVEIVDETDRMEIEENKSQQNQEAPETNEQEDGIQLTKAGDIYSGGDLNNLMEIIEESPSAEEGTQGHKLQDSESFKDSENKEDGIQAEDTTNETMVDQNNQTQEKEQSSEAIVETVDVYITEIVTATQYVESQELTGLTIARRFIPKVPRMEDDDDDKPAETQEEIRENPTHELVNIDDGEKIQDEKEIVQEVENEGVVEVSEGNQEPLRNDGNHDEENSSEKEDKVIVTIVTEEINQQPNLNEMQEEIALEKDNNDIQAEHDQLIEQVQEEMVPEIKNQDIQEVTESVSVEIQEEMVPEIKDQNIQEDTESAPVEIQEEMVIEIKNSQENNRQNLVEMSEQMIIPEEKENIQPQYEESGPIEERQEEMTPEQKEDIQENYQEEIIPEQKEDIQENYQEEIIPEINENIQAHEEQIDQFAPAENQGEMIPEIKESQGQYEENNRQDLREIPEQMIVTEENANPQVQYNQEEEIAYEVKSNPQTHESQIDQSAPVEMQEEMIIETKESQGQEQNLVEMSEQMLIPEDKENVQAQIEEVNTSSPMEERQEEMIPEQKEDIQENYQEEMIPEIKEDTQGNYQEAMAPVVNENIQAHEEQIDQFAPAENQGEMIPEIKESQGQIEHNCQQILTEAPEERENMQAQDEQINFSNMVQIQEEIIIPEETHDKSSPIKESQALETEAHVQAQEDQIDQSARMEMQEEMVIETKESQGQEEENNRQDLVEISEQMIIPAEKETTQAETEEINISSPIQERQEEIPKENAQENSQEEIVPEIRENIQEQNEENNQPDSDKMQEEIIPEVNSSPAPVTYSSQIQMEILDAPRDENLEKEQEIIEQQEYYENIGESIPNKDENEEIIEEMKPETPKQSQPTFIIAETQIPTNTVKNSQPTFIIAETQEFEITNNNNIGAIENLLEPIYEAERELEVVESPKKAYVEQRFSQEPVSEENNERMEILDLPKEQEVAESPNKAHIEEREENNERMEILDLPKEQQETQTEHKEISQEPAIHQSEEQMEIIESPKETEVRDQAPIEVLESPPKETVEAQVQEQINEGEEIVESPEEAETSSVREIYQEDQELACEGSKEQAYEEVRIFEISKETRIEVLSDQNQQEVMEILDEPREQIVIDIEHKEIHQEVEILESPNEVEIQSPQVVEVVESPNNEGVMEILDSPQEIDDAAEKEVMEIVVESPKYQEENHDMIILGSEAKENQVEIVSVGSPKTPEEIQIDSSKKGEGESQQEEDDEEIEEQQEEIEILESEEEEHQQGKKNRIEQIYQEFAQEDIIDVDEQEDQGERIYEEIVVTEVKEVYNVTEEEILQNYIKPRAQLKIQEDEEDKEDVEEHDEEGDDFYLGDEDTSLKKEEEGAHHEYRSASAKKGRTGASSARREYTVYEDWRILESLAAFERQNGPAGSKSIKTWETLKDPLTKRRLLEDERTAESLKTRMHKTLCLLTDEDKEEIVEYIAGHSKEEAMAAFCKFEHDRRTEKKKFKGISTELKDSAESRKTPHGQSQKSTSKKKKSAKSDGLLQKAFEDNQTEEPENDEIEDIVIPIDESSLPRENMFYPSMGQHHYRDNNASDEGFITEPNSLNYEMSFNQPFAFANNSRSNSGKKIVRNSKNNNHDDVQFISATKTSTLLFQRPKEEPPKEEVMIISRTEAMQQHNQGSGKSERQKDSKKRKDYRMPGAPKDPEEFTNCLKKVKTTKYFEERSLLISDEFKYKFSAEKEKFNPPPKDINVFVDPDHNFRQFVVESSQQTEENSSQNIIIERLAQIAVKYHVHQEDILRMFHSVSNDFDDLLLYLKTKNEFIPWELSEDQDLLENDPTAIRYLRQLKGEERMNRRREYLMGE